MKKLFSIILSLAFAISANAQLAYEAYFTQGHPYRSYLNPAFATEHGYLGLFVLGNLNVGHIGHFNLEDFIYPKNGETVTFLNHSVSYEEYAANLEDKNDINLQLSEDLFNLGFNAWGGFNTIGVRAVANAGVNIPKELLLFFKKGVENKLYDFSDLDAYGQAYAEVAIGHSRAFLKKKQLRVGAKIKALLGLGYADLQVDKMQLFLDEDDWTITTNASFESNVKDITEALCDNELDIDDDFALDGFGMAIDLGAVYKLNKQWQFSLALLDLGMISWKQAFVANTGGENAVRTSNYLFSFNEDSENFASDELDRLQDDIKALFEFESVGDQGKHNHWLRMTVNAGAEYTLPIYKRLTFGALFTTRFDEVNPLVEGRLSANIAPLKCLSFSLSGAAGNRGVSAGWILDLHARGFYFNVGMSRISVRYTKEFIPLTSNIGITFGMGIGF